MNITITESLKRLKKRHLYYITLMVISLMTVVIALKHENYVSNIHKSYKPLKNDIQNLKSDFILMHLWMEKFIAGDDRLSEDLIFSSFDTFILKIKELHSNRIIENIAYNKTKTIEENSKKLFLSAKEKIKNKHSPESLQDNQFDKLFNSTLNELNILIRMVDINRNKEITLTSSQSNIIILMYIFSLIIFGVIIYFIEENINQNIKDIKRKETLLMEQSKLSSLGEMIGNIAHQWRQPLSVITTGASGMKIKQEYEKLEPKFIDEICDTIIQSSEYLSQTIDEFRNYIKENNTQSDFNIFDTLKSVLKLTKDTYGNHNIKIIKNSKQSHIIINGYENELIQAFINIMNNAKDALVLNIKESSKRYLFINIYEREQRCIVEFYDNAGGIDKKILPRIFEPYFTTKHQSVGTGLGLYITHKILTKHLNASINVENIKFKYYDKKYKGAKFTIEIPLK